MPRVRALPLQSSVRAGAAANQAVGPGCREPLPDAVDAERSGFERLRDSTGVRPPVRRGRAGTLNCRQQPPVIVR